MTSTASPQNTPAPNSTTSAPSYASAAGANKKPTSTPLIASGSNQASPVVVGSSTSAPQNGKAPTPAVNGRPSITPAVPTAPAVVRGSVNGGSAAHNRTSSVTISANGPSGHVANGSSVGSVKANMPQFGYESPAVAHSTPQAGNTAPIPVPQIPSPAHSPSPIPQTSGGQRAPSSTQPNVTFGFPGEGDRQMNKPAIPQNPMAMGHHNRRDSQASGHGDHAGSGPNRGGYQGNRGGRPSYNNPPYNGQPMGYPPNNQNFGGNRGGRGGAMYQGGRGGAVFNQSPRHSPATVHAMPGPGTPNMGAAQPIPPAGQQFYPPPPVYSHPQHMGGAPYNVPMNHQFAQPMYPGQYPPQPQMYGPPPGAQGFHGQYAPAPYNPGQVGAAPMSRNSSQVSERPASSTGQNQAPVVAQGTPQQRPSQAPPAVVSSSNFVRQPKKTTIVIKNANGEVVDLKSQFKAPASPAPSLQSKTPPVIASTPTPPPKPATPSHARVESSKTAEQLRNEFKDAVQKAKEDEGKEAIEKAAAEAKAKEEKLREEERIKEEERKAEEEAKAAEEAKAKAKAEAEAKAKAEAEAKAKAEAEAEAEAKAKAEAEAEAAAKAKSEPKPADDEDEIERMIREMEEEDARREKEQEEITKKKKVEAAAAKDRAEVDRVAKAADNDRKLQEQEREMERLEEEKDRKRQQGESKDKESVADLLAKKIDDLKLSDTKDSGSSTPTSVTGKSSSEGPKAAEKPRAKPAALNLAPLNTKPVEPPQPSAALQSLKSARFLTVMGADIYPPGIASPNPALNAAVAKKGKTFKYDAQFLLQFQKVFIEQPSMEFHQQVKSLIGDNDGSRSASVRTPGAGPGRAGSSRGAPAGGFPAQQGTMGQFGAAKSLPPGTTSEQRFAMSQGTMARPPSVNPMASFGRTGTFPSSSQMSRTPSSTNMGGIPNSPRQGSRSARGGSKRTDYSAKAEAAAAKSMPLTQGIDVKPITVSATGWKPNSLARAPTGAAAQAAHMDPETVQRKVKAALNKMTPEKFDKIADQILEIASQSKNEQDGRTLRQVIQLTFEKATDEAHWASMYAKFCKRMLDTMSPEIRDETVLDKNNNVVNGGALFRKYLLNRCQEDFERGWKVDMPEAKEGEAKESVMLSDEYYVAAAAKRRGLGLIQFIGELFKLGMLTERIMHECVRKLLDFQGVPDEAEIESLTKLLRTIGTNLDTTEKGKVVMDAYFQRIHTIVEHPELPSRLKFMLMDVVDLRSKHWISKEQNKGPKTLEEVRAEAEAAAAQKAAENARNSSQRGAPGGRPPAGRGDSRNFSYSQQAPNQVGMDELRRLRGASSRPSSQNVSFGPTSMFNSRSNSGRQRLAPGGAFGRAGEDSGASSRTGTPPTRERDSVAHTNAFGLLADTGENPASPPSTAASPALSKVALDTGSSEKKD